MSWNHYRKVEPVRAMYIESHADLPDRDDVNANLRQRELVDVETSEGTLSIRCPFWLAKDTQGNVYPIRPEVFNRIYAPVEDSFLQALLSAHPTDCRIVFVDGHGEARFDFRLAEVDHVDGDGYGEELQIHVQQADEPEGLP